MASSSENRSSTAHGAPSPAEIHDRLRPLCERSLGDSYDPSRHLFAHQLFDGGWREVDSIYPHETLTSSAIALLGIARSKIDPASLGVDLDRCLGAMIDEIGRTSYLGGVGLALWANAVSGGSRTADEYLRAAGLSLERTITDTLPALTTMESAWLASGLLHEFRRTGDATVRDAATTVVDELRTNRYDARTRLMHHAGPGAALLHRARGHIANFADQIYSVQAFAFAAATLDDDRALVTGNALAARHCELQGPLGQWWWHYDARRGHVALRYAVYSVHQHGMAPMALRALALAGGDDHGDAIAASIGWIERNESGASMIDATRSTVWRNVDRRDGALAHRARGLLEAVGLADDREPADVVLNRETRPYEWAWCLYADAMLRGVDRGDSIA